MADSDLNRGHSQERGHHNSTDREGRFNKTKCGINTPVMKLPSDSTLYMPALRHEKNDDDIINKISNFVDDIRIQSCDRTTRTPTPKRRSSIRDDNEESPMARPIREGLVNHGRQSMSCSLPQKENPMKLARETTDKILMEADQARLDLIAPKGMSEVNKNIQLIRTFDNDDDFFHVSCHVELNLKQKIEKGEYVDSEKLLPKERAGLYPTEDETHPRLEILKQAGHMYLSPAQRLPKINNVKRWDQDSVFML